MSLTWNLEPETLNLHQWRACRKNAEARQLAFGNDQPPDGGSAARGCVDIHDGAAEADVAGGHVKLRRLEGDGRFLHAVDAAA